MALAGYKVRVFVGTSAGSIDTPLNGMDDHNLNRLRTMLEKAQFGDEHQSRFGGPKDSNVDMSGRYLPGDAGLGLLEANFEDDDAVYIRVMNDDDYGMSGEIIVESFQQTGSRDGRQEMSIQAHFQDTPTKITP